MDAAEAEQTKSLRVVCDPPEGRITHLLPSVRPQFALVALVTLEQKATEASNLDIP